MANSSFKNLVLSTSPYFEVLVRHIYWRNVGLFKAISEKIKFIIPNKPSPELSGFSYDTLRSFLSSNGVKHNSLMLVHSTYSPFKGKGKTANQLIDFLLDIVGDGGTLAMPAMPKLTSQKPSEDYLKDSTDEVFFYDPMKSKVKTGVLPLMLSKRSQSIRSEHPINTMVALGPLAKEIMDNNLSGSDPLPCGESSSWFRCYQNDAVIVGLGLDLTHSLTMIHVAEDTNKNWPVKDWYIERQFSIKTSDGLVNKTLKERAPQWGALYFAERTLCSDLISNGILKSTVIDGITVELLHARKLMDFLKGTKHDSYPYYGVKNAERKD
ncbi:AAC(3) family N-acetyltransferase [Vibrio gigantis]|uniref:AAC(3) family N-acetyltransferase n=1 Tax=Vibrio gigantis TaxID=296199 RepID=UPI001BFD1F5D|nr:AAC(3) family N-acetyltransferase [Vibrio gigantis]